MSIIDNMKITIDEVRDNLTIIDKDYNEITKGNEIININLSKDNKLYNINLIIKLIAIITELTDLETNIYNKLIKKAIELENNMQDSSIIICNKDYIYKLTKYCNCSISSIYRGLAGLTIKGIIKKIDDCKYIFNYQYNISNRYNHDVKYITIKL